MSSFTVHTPALAAAAVVIDASSRSAGDARTAAASAAGQSGAFGGEPIAVAYEAMCSRAQTAIEELEDLTAGGAGRSQPFKDVLSQATAAGRVARAAAEANQGAVGRAVLKQAVEWIAHYRPLPLGVKDAFTAIIDHGSAYLHGTVIKLVELQSRLHATGTASGRAAAQVIGAILRGIGR